MKQLKKVTIHKDMYFRLLHMSWPMLILTFFSFYVLCNFLFASLYYCTPASIGGADPDFMTAFYFSVQTISTIGYGSLIPSGGLANFLVLIESFVGVIMAAVFTGVVFARLSRPSARIRFSKNVLHTKYDGIQSLCLRIGNTRGNNIIEAQVKLSALFNEVTLEGEKLRRIYPLKLARSYSPFFQLSWLIIHPIDEESPFKNGISDHFEGLMLTVTGHDGTYSTSIYDHKVYGKSDIIFDKYFEDIMEETINGSVVINYQNFDDLKPSP